MDSKMMMGDCPDNQLIVSWKRYNQLVSRAAIRSQLAVPLGKLQRLLEARFVRTEFLALKKSARRIIIRLRNNKLSRILLRLCKLMHQLFAFKVGESLQPINCFLAEKIDGSGNVTLLSPKQFGDTCSLLTRLVKTLTAIVRSSLNAFGHCMPWMRLGHLADHTLICVSLMSRLFVTTKAMLVYTGDMITGMSYVGEKFGYAREWIDGFRALIDAISKEFDISFKQIDQTSDNIHKAPIERYDCTVIPRSSMAVEQEIPIEKTMAAAIKSQPTGEKVKKSKKKQIKKSIKRLKKKASKKLKNKS